MVTFALPSHFNEEFTALIPRQRFVINQMMVEGVVLNYSLAADRSQLWAIMTAESEFELMEELARMPLIDFLEPEISQLMFHNSAMEVMQFSLN
ncbi:MAG: hypothetical protein D6772_12700 [Bacteroidetes bacterium]|nr:MAG: hypothetical protein D6772_12700 [Bacteroidota bacterium]